MSGRNPLEVRICPVQSACDGDVIYAKKKDQSMCGKCERMLAKRRKGLAKPKGTRLYPEDGDV